MDDLVDVFIWGAGGVVRKYLTFLCKGLHGQFDPRVPLRLRM